MIALNMSKNRTFMKSSKNFLETDAPLKVVLKLAIPSMLAQFVNV